ncbi:MAG: PucR family transcriptional regulator ligand-binding domain-containing protein [Bacillota bacterium]
MQGITVNQALELLKVHGAILKAGRNGLTNIIDSVSVLEIAKWHQWVHGGELYLTTLSALKSKEEVYELIRAFAEKKVAALGIHPGNQTQIPLDDTAYELADEVNLPILLLPRSIPYSTVFSVILSAILNKQKLMLEKSQQINKYLTDILLTGGSFENIALSLKRILNQPVLITDSFLEVLALVGTGKVSTEDFGIEALEALRSMHALRLVETVTWWEGNPSIKTYCKESSKINAHLLLTKVAVGTELYGYVVTLAEKHFDHELDVSTIALTHAATAVALEESKRRAIEKAEQKLNMDFLEDLLNQRYDSEETIIQRAKHLGFELKGKHMVMVVDIDQLEEYYLRNLEAGEGHIQEVKNRIYKIVEFVVMSRNKKSLIIPKSDSLIVLPHMAGEVKEEVVKTMLLQLAKEIILEANRTLKDLTISIGIGGYCEKITKLAVSYRQAEQALSIGQKVSGGNNIYDYQQMGILSLLVTFGSQELKERCRSNLTNLLEYDAANRAELTKTMEVYLDCNENISKTAEKLFVHINTVKYRLERIKEILGKDPFSNGEEKLYYHLSLKALKVL